MENNNGKSTPHEKKPHRMYANPTEDTAMSNLIREERNQRKEQTKELKRLLLKDLKSVHRRASAMGSKTVNFYQVPVKNLELVIAALQRYKG